MEKLWKKISGLFFASLMAVTLTGKANAENDEAALPEPAPTAVVENAAEATPPVQEAPAPREEPAPAPAAEAEAPKPSEEAPVSEAPAPAAEAPASAASAAAAEEPAPAAEVPTEEASVPAEEESPAPAAEETAPATEEEAVSPSEEGPVLAAEEEETPVPEADEEDAPASAAGEDLAPAAEEDGPTGGALSGAAPPRSDAGAAMTSAGAGLRGVSGGDGSGEDEPEGLVDPVFNDGESEPEAGLIDPVFEDEEPDELNLVLEPDPRAVTAGKDITIRTAGLKHITTLDCSGDVSIIGTGILLVDEVVLHDGFGVYLQSFEEIYGPDGGTVALFVLTGEQDGMRTYTLVNGVGSDGTTVIPAVLDEEYVIPAGVNLVVPEGGSLLMQAVLALAETQGDTTVVNYSLDGYPKGTLSGEDVTAEKISTAPVLTIAHGAGLVIDRGADFCLAEAGGTTMLTRNLPQINVQGELTLNGDAKAETFGGADIVIADSGDVSGSGCFFRCTVSVQGDRSTGVTSLGVSEATLWLDEISGSDICALRVEGNATIRYKADFSVDTVCVNNGILSITNEVLGAAATMTVTQGISGTNGSIRLEAGELIIPNAAGCTIPVKTGGWKLDSTYSDEYFDGSERWDNMGYVRSAAGEGTLRYSSGTLTGAPLVPLVGEVAVDGDMVAIPVADGNCTDYVHSLDRGSFTQITGLERAVDDENEPLSFTCPTGEQITYASLIKALGAEFPGNIPDMSDSSVVKYEYLVLTYADGAYGYVLFDPAGSQSVAASDVVQICRMVYLIAFEPAGGATTTSTNTAYTGSGVLGGSGAGNVSGGPRRLALTGSREPVEIISEDPDPDPGPEPTPDHDPEPDPEPAPAVQPADDLRVWAETVESGCYMLHIESDGTEVPRLAVPVTVRMDYSPAPGTENKPMFAVFRKTDGTLAVFEAHYDPLTGQLVFDADLAGEFVVVAFAFDGEPFTEDFYLALADLAEIKALLA